MIYDLIYNEDFPKRTNSKSIILTPDVVFYRGYSKKQVGRKGISKRKWKTYGCCTSAAKYADSESEGEDIGIVYAYRAKWPLNLFILNNYTVCSLIDLILDTDMRDKCELSCSLAFAFGCKNMDILENILAECPNIKSCLKLREKIDDFLYGRFSAYDIDMPLIGKLGQILKEYNYDGMYSYVEEDYDNEIFIFNPDKTLYFNPTPITDCEGIKSENFYKNINKPLSLMFT